MGKKTFLSIPDLPAAIERLEEGGYHAAAINENTHSTFEELPCLGVCGDLLMSASAENRVAANIMVAVPEGTVANANLCGNMNAASRRQSWVECIHWTQEERDPK
ncbi:unnamed protein product [Bemisia tabaci]|uniref:Uncharacterized protein n=1 Tax=Bemisia tabaci TaxID=7038 RepID=A0A9P0A3C2_BEMTA|nr:unnamed protein product [Bemisia tabaci]